MPPRLVLFDIGSTLWSSPPEDAGALAYCYGRARDLLLSVLPEVPPVETLIDTVEGYGAEWEAIWKDAASYLTQAPTSQYVAEALQRLAISPEAAILETFTDLVMETSIYTAKVEPPEPGMKEALAALTQRGLRLGCVSNAFMTAADLDRVMDERGLGPYLELTVSSCEAGYRKPHPAIYEAALEAFGVAGKDAVFVGDRLDADVEGPAARGMGTVLTRQYRDEDPGRGEVRPDHVIDHLSELVPYMESLLEE